MMMRITAAITPIGAQNLTPDGGTCLPTSPSVDDNVEK